MSEPKKPQPRVINCSVPTCTYCNTAKPYFSEKGIQFEDINVSRDMAAARDILLCSGQMGVPVTYITGKIVVGFVCPKTEHYLGIKQYKRRL